MNLQSCPECGVVVDFDKLKEAKSDEDKKKKGYKYEDKYEQGFYCPVCNKWVYVFID